MLEKGEPVHLPVGLQRDILEWFEEVILPQSSADGTFDKFLDELEELKNAREFLHELDAANIPKDEDLRYQAMRDVCEEAADVVISFLAWCHAAHIPLRQVVQDKHKINRGRTWGPPDERGVRRHVG